MKKIAKNLQYLRKQRGLSQEAMADELGITRSRIGSYEENRSEPPIDTLIQLSEFFGLPIDVLVKNDISLSKEKSFIELGNHRVLFPIVVNDQNEDIIEVVPVKASAGYLNGYADPEYIEQLGQIKLPFIPTGKHRAFPIKGDSMLPIREGSWVIGKYMENVSEIKNGRTYVLLTKDQGIVYKRVYRTEEEGNVLILKSDNKTYEPYPVMLSDVLEIWEFTCSIRTEEYDEGELKVDSIMRMLRELQVELEPLRK
ncbi:MAG: XRE family transcriptional regulator [Vicingaceae bacterium]